MHNQHVVRLFDKDGNESDYRRFSARLPEFLEKYPPAEGWSVQHEVVEASSIATGLHALHLAAITAGKKPSDLGIPPLPTGFIYTAKLVDPNGTVVATGSSVGLGIDMTTPPYACRDAMRLQKDHEAAETAAFQRLIAALGFRGDVLDADESATQRQMGMAPVASHEQVEVRAKAEKPDDVLARLVPVTSDPKAEPESITEAAARAFDEAPASAEVEPTKPVEAASVDAAVSKASAPAEDVANRRSDEKQDGRASAVAGEGNLNAPALSAKPTEVGRGARAPSTRSLLVAKQRQITVLARMLGVEAVKVATDEEADAELARLAALNSAKQAT